MWGYGHMGGLGYGYGLGFGLDWIFMLIFWGLVIWAIFALVRGVSGGGCCGHIKDKEHKTTDAVDILKERYAKGEISKEEFEEMKKTLQ
ncbi:MAG: SHOCT domain-containing protein [Candidatus Moranbacteria bacterium]|nr:SHOCT domain-containing protein [Candidatus Moranbacteria bacterium]